MFIKKEKSEKFTISGGTEGAIYPSSLDGDFTLARVKMDGVYPEKGYSLNDVSKETLFMLSGIFNVEIDGEIFEIKEGDVLSVLPGKKYRIKGEGEAIDVITPAWEKNNNQIIDK